MILLLPLGAIVGFFFGGLLVGVVAMLLSIPMAMLGLVGTLVLLTTLPGVLAPLAIGLLPVAALLAGLLSVFLVTGLFYALATLGVLGPIAATPLSLTATNPLPASALELFSRGLLIGMSASINFAVWVLATGNPAIATFFAVLTFAAAIPGVSGLVGYQFVIGWLSWLLPMSYVFFVIPIGLLLFLVAAPAAIAASGIGAVRFDARTCTFETAGGAVIGFLVTISPAGFAGFNLGNFTFLSLPAATPLAAVQGSFVTASVSSHETGHTLNQAAFGGAFHWMNALDENVGPMPRGRLAYGELTAESHARRVGSFFVLLW